MQLKYKKWINARFKSKCKKCKIPINKGETCLYCPDSKSVYCETCGEPISHEVITATNYEALY